MDLQPDYFRPPHRETLHRSGHHLNDPTDEDVASRMVPGSCRSLETVRTSSQQKDASDLAHSRSEDTFSVSSYYSFLTLFILFVPFFKDFNFGRRFLLIRRGRNTFTTPLMIYQISMNVYTHLVKPKRGWYVFWLLLKIGLCSAISFKRSNCK